LLYNFHFIIIYEATDYIILRSFFEVIMMQLSGWKPCN